MKSVLEGLPTLQVLHDPDGGWAIADGIGDPNEDGACIATHICHVVANDPTLEPLATMPPGTQADRKSPTEAWEFAQFAWEE